MYLAVTTSAETAAHALLDWCAAFGAPVQFMSDGPTHFQNETVRLLAKGLCTHHYFTIPYCPWSNGAAERLGKKLLRVMRSLLSELQQRPTEWPQLVPLVQRAINNSPSLQRNQVAPITEFTGHSPSTPISTFLHSHTSEPITITEAQQERAFNVNALITAMEDLHPMVEHSLATQRQRMRTVKSKGELENFREGDFVLVAREHFNEGEKLYLRWSGPQRFKACVSDFAFEVEDLRNGNLDTVHGTRLNFYVDDSLDADAIVLASETGIPVSRLLRLVELDNKIYVLVRWKGLNNTDDTLGPIDRVYEDVPQLLVKLLLLKNTPNDLRTNACAKLGLEEDVCNDSTDRST